MCQGLSLFKVYVIYSLSLNSWCSTKHILTGFFFYYHGVFTVHLTLGIVNVYPAVNWYLTYDRYSKYDYLPLPSMAAGLYVPQGGWDGYGWNISCQGLNCEFIRWILSYRSPFSNWIHISQHFQSWSTSVSIILVLLLLTPSVGFVINLISANPEGRGLESQCKRATLFGLPHPLVDIMGNQKRIHLVPCPWYGI